MFTRLALQNIQPIGLDGRRAAMKAPTMPNGKNIMPYVPNASASDNVLYD
jgi:hypothetical protein